ncbi:hypothetical protein [Flocculibacter collagenilyticus]|uniref:hypothetical protein n=1 Tax=Flocculibacter collagenilyticus TaxID=2744479 RepID=UPI0018F64CA5|nr:hypothetical protein [Flocculibacter collagenilyticus]
MSISFNAVKPTVFSFMLLYVFLSSTVTAAQNKVDACLKKDPITSQLQCLDQHIASLQRIQESWENSLTVGLEEIARNKGRKDALAKAKKEKIFYDKMVKESCGWQYLLQLPNTQVGALFYKKCEIKMIEQRIDNLKYFSNLLK